MHCQPRTAGVLGLTACILSLAKSKAEAGVKDGAEDGSIVGIVHQNLFVNSIEYER